MTEEPLGIETFKTLTASQRTQLVWLIYRLDEWERAKEHFPDLDKYKALSVGMLPFIPRKLAIAAIGWNRGEAGAHPLRRKFKDYEEKICTLVDFPSPRAIHNAWL